MTVLPGPDILHQGDRFLPSYIKVGTDGLLQIPNVKDLEKRLFNVIYDYGYSRGHLIHEVPIKERVIRNNGGSVRFIGLDDPNVTRAMNSVTEINLSSGPRDSQARYQYQRNLYQAFVPIARDVKKHIDGNAVFFPPLNGGALIKAFFQSLRVIDDPRNVADYELKRAQLDDGRLMVGVVENYYPDGDFQTGVVIDDCLATDVSVSTTIDLMRKRYPSIHKFIIAVSAATQRGLLELEKELGQVDHRIIAAIPVFAMTNHNYLLRAQGEGFPQGTLTVGDMGEWAEALSAGFNINAPWNEYR